MSTSEAPSLSTGSSDGAADAQLNLVAGELLGRFRQHDDVEAFGALVELAQGRLLILAQAVARRHGLALDAEDLVAGFMARLFTDVRKDQPRVRQFLALAYTTMRYEALNQVRLQHRARLRGETWEQSRAACQEPDDPVDAWEQASEAREVAVVLLSAVGAAMRRLPERDRRILSLRELDGRSYEDLADVLEVPRNQVGMVLKRARGRLARGIADALRCPAVVRRDRAALSRTTP